MKPEAFLPLKPHWFHVLLSLADREQHGYGIMREVLDRTSGKVRLWPATLNTSLDSIALPFRMSELTGTLENRPDCRRVIQRSSPTVGSAVMNVAM